MRKLFTTALALAALTSIGASGTAFAISNSPTPTVPNSTGVVQKPKPTVFNAPTTLKPKPKPNPNPGPVTPGYRCAGPGSLSPGCQAAAERQRAAQEARAAQQAAAAAASAEKINKKIGGKGTQEQ